MSDQKKKTDNMTHREHIEELQERFPYTLKLLEKQCEMVGTTVDDIDLSDKKWYTQHKWTYEQKRKFEDWMVEYLKNSYEARQEICRHPMRTNEKYLYQVAGRDSLGYTFNYGWTQKEYDNID